MTRTRGNYYANAHEIRDGRRYGREVARQAMTFKAARAALDAVNLPGYVQCWSDRTQSRAIVAERDDQGNWTVVNPYTGEREALTS